MARYSALIEQMQGGLGKLPDYEGTVYRGAELPPAVLEQHQVGAVVTYPAFTSTSYRWLQGYAGTHDFVILSKHGKKIEFVGNIQEYEVLFRPGTSFRILSRTELPGGGPAGRVSIETEEID